jgi:chromosome segregation ATPase
MEKKLKLLLVLVVVIMAVAVVQRFYERGRWQERKDDLETQVDSTDQYWSEKYTQDSTAWARRTDSLQQRDSALVADSTRLAQEAAARTMALERSLAQLKQLRARLDPSTLPPEGRDLLVAFEQALEKTKASLTTCHAQLATAQERRSGCEVQLADRDEQVVALEHLRGRLTAERDSARALNKPPPLLSLTLEVGAGVACVVLPIGTNAEPACGLSVQVNVVRFRIPLF